MCKEIYNPLSLALLFRQEKKRKKPFRHPEQNEKEKNENPIPFILRLLRLTIMKNKEKTADPHFHKNVKLKTTRLKEKTNNMEKREEITKDRGRPKQNNNLSIRFSEPLAPCSSVPSSSCGPYRRRRHCYGLGRCYQGP